MKNLKTLLREARKEINEDLPTGQEANVDQKDAQVLLQALPDAINLSKTGNKKATFNQKAVENVLARLTKVPDKKRFLYAVDNKTLMHLEAFLRELISNNQAVNPETAAAAKKLDNLLANRFYA